MAFDGKAADQGRDCRIGLSPMSFFVQVTGEEEPMYHARVMVASKVRKNDLPVKNGDTVGIIRTTSCPKGKWLARDASNRCELMSCFVRLEVGFKALPSLC